MWNQGQVNGQKLGLRIIDRGRTEFSTAEGQNTSKTIQDEKRQFKMNSLLKYDVYGKCRSRLNWEKSLELG